MPLNLVVGNKGLGKTSFLVYQVRKAYFERGELIKRRSVELTTQINKDDGYNLTPPSDIPIFTSPKLKMKFLVGWYKYYEPYLINPYYIGTNDNSGKPLMFTPPGSIFLIPELQDVLNSRKSATFPDVLTTWFAESRHWDIEFWGDGQRGNLMDLNFREITDRIYEMHGVENELDIIGRVTKTTWHCHEFENLKAYDENRYIETEYEYLGNIFECYNSKQCRSDFIPPKGMDFKYLKHLSNIEISKLPPEEAALYSMNEPEWFRKNKIDEKEKTA